MIGSKLGNEIMNIPSGKIDFDNVRNLKHTDLTGLYRQSSANVNFLNCCGKTRAGLASISKSGSSSFFSFSSSFLTSVLSFSVSSTSFSFDASFFSSFFEVVCESLGRFEKKCVTYVGVELVMGMEELSMTNWKNIGRQI